MLQSPQILPQADMMEAGPTRRYFATNVYHILAK